MFTVAIHTLGCKVNQYESYAILAAFEQDGFSVVSPADPADVYIVNSCTVTSTSDKKSLQILRRLRRQSPHALIVLCGCYPQAFPERAAELSEANLILGSRNKSEILGAVKQLLAGKTTRRVEILPHTTGEPFESMMPPRFPGRTRAYLKIQDGCEQRCSYCIIPDARGPIRSKPLEELRAELRELANAGYREIVLVGINLSSYGLEWDLTLTDAIAAAQETPGLDRIRLGSLEPERLDRKLIMQWRAYDKFCPQFHLSLQSGCDRTLSRMCRQYDAATYRTMIFDLREAFPGCAITTDVMVAFPGETEQDHQTSQTFVREIGFARAHIFVYSPRQGTPAAAMDDQIPAETGKRRAKEMAAAAHDAAQEFLAAQAGSVQPVLFEQESEGFWQGYTPNYTFVKVKSDRDLTGEILDVRLGVARDGCCDGVLLDGSESATSGAKRS